MDKPKRLILAHKNRAADRGDRAVESVGLRSLACWDCEFESRQGRRCVCCEYCACLGTGLGDGPIPRPEKSYGVWCV